MSHLSFFVFFFFNFVSFLFFKTDRPYLIAPEVEWPHERVQINVPRIDTTFHIYLLRKNVFNNLPATTLNFQRLSLQCYLEGNCRCIMLYRFRLFWFARPTTNSFSFYVVFRFFHFLNFTRARLLVTPLCCCQWKTSSQAWGRKSLISVCMANWTSL